MDSEEVGCCVMRCVFGGWRKGGGRRNLNPAVIERSIGARWRTGGITEAAEAVYVIGVVCYCFAFMVE